MITVGFQLVAIDPTSFRGLGRDGIGEIPLKDDGSLADALKMIGMDAKTGFPTMISGEPVPPDNRAEATLNDGDQVVIFPTA